MNNQSPPSKMTLSLEDLLCFSIYSTNHAMNRIYKPLLDKLDLTYPQYLVMIVLWGEDRQTVKGLGSQLFLESNTLTPLLKRLEKTGYVTRQRDTVDERQVLICLTPQGKALEKKAREIPSCISESAGITKEIVEFLQEHIGVLRKNLQSSACGGDTKE